MQLTCTSPQLTPHCCIQLLSLIPSFAAWRWEKSSCAITSVHSIILLPPEICFMAASFIFWMPCRVLRTALKSNLTVCNFWKLLGIYFCHSSPHASGENTIFLFCPLPASVGFVPLVHVWNNSVPALKNTKNLFVRTGVCVKFYFAWTCKPTQVYMFTFSIVSTLSLHIMKYTIDVKTATSVILTLVCGHHHIADLSARLLQLTKT